MVNTFRRFTLFLTYWLLVIHLPDRLSSTQLDPSWAGALSYFIKNRLDFGVDVVFTFGPLGYIYSNISSGHLLNETRHAASHRKHQRTFITAALVLRDARK